MTCSRCNQKEKIVYEEFNDEGKSTKRFCLECTGNVLREWESKLKKEVETFQKEKK